MPPVEANAPPEDTSSQKPKIGIIYPPPEVRNIVDKTAVFVGRNGPDFESRIRQNELNNPKFNFLNPNDPYHAYYQHRVKECKEGKIDEPSSKGSGLGIMPTRMQQQQSAQAAALIAEPPVPKEAPPEFEFIADPPSISAFDLDVVKLTAQFVARNGRPFLTNLMNREQRNYQFDFLRPQHSLFNYFTKLVEQYTKVLIPPKDLLPKLRREAEDSRWVLEAVKSRVDWARYQEREKRKEEEAKEQERVAYAQIDWHDFVVVETVDFQPNETGNLPPPTTPEEVGARLIAQERYERTTPAAAEDGDVEMDMESSDEEFEVDDEAGDKTRPGVDTTVQDMEEDSDDEGDGPPGTRPPPPLAGKPPGMLPPSQPPLPPVPPPPPKAQPPPLPPTPDQVIIKKDYNPKTKVTAAPPAPPDAMLVSPITGERIPADKMSEHLRIGLLDPKWIEQRDRAQNEKREQEEVFAAGSSIGSQLQRLAERRTDIFGSGAEETQIGKKIGEEERKKPDKVIWDGHTASMEKVTQKARENISIEEQIAVIHKSKGLVEDKEKERIGPSVPGVAPVMPRPPAPPTAPRPKAPQVPASEPMKTVPKPPTAAVPAPPRPPIGVPPQPRPPQMMVMMPQPPAMGPPMGMMPPRPPMMAPPGLGGPPMGYMTGPPAGAPRPQPPPELGGKKPAPGGDGGPPAKKARTEDDLIPEADFLARNPSQVTFKVVVPKQADKPEWNLNGQTLSFTLPLTDNVSVIKAKISESLTMPAGKQKLQLEGMFIKDSNTLAFYNFSKTSAVQLQLKERGGRKK